MFIAGNERWIQDEQRMKARLPHFWMKAIDKPTFISHVTLKVYTSNAQLVCTSVCAFKVQECHRSPWNVCAGRREKPSHLIKSSDQVAAGIVKICLSSVCGFSAELHPPEHSRLVVISDRETKANRLFLSNQRSNKCRAFIGICSILVLSTIMLINITGRKKNLLC